MRTDRLSRRRTVASWRLAVSSCKLRRCRRWPRCVSHSTKREGATHQPNVSDFRQAEAGARTSERRAARGKVRWAGERSCGNGVGAPADCVLMSGVFADGRASDGQDSCAVTPTPGLLRSNAMASEGPKMMPCLGRAVGRHCDVQRGGRRCCQRRMWG